MPPSPVNFRDVTKVVRRTWEQFKYGGYGLGPVAEYYGQTVLFTGKANVPGHELSILAAQIGFKVVKNITEKIDL